MVQNQHEQCQRVTRATEETAPGWPSNRGGQPWEGDVHDIWEGNQDPEEGAEGHPAGETAAIPGQEGGQG